MNDELRIAIRALQSEEDATTQAAFAEIAEMGRYEPVECATELSGALLDELAIGALRTPRLLTLLGIMRQPVPACLPICLDLLRDLATMPSLPPTDALLGAAAIVAQTHPQALLPDIEAMQTSSQASQEFDQQKTKVLQFLLEVSSEFLRELPDSAVSGMVRWLWHDCALFDLMTLVDFAGLQVEYAGADDPIVGLMVDLVERLPATADQKEYAGQSLQHSGVGANVMAQLKSTWRAIRVAPTQDPATIGSPTIADPEPPHPDGRVDQYLAAFAEGSESEVELARVYLDRMFENAPLPAGLAWWVVLTVDSLPPWRRRMDIDWALVQIGTAQRRYGEQVTLVPPSLLGRWLDTPQLLSENGTKIALDLLSRQQPGLVVQRYLHRAVAASTEGYAEILMGGLWRALADNEPAAVLAVTSRWITYGFGQSDFLELLIELLMGRARVQPAMIDTLDDTLVPSPDTPSEVIEVAREILDQLRQQS